MYATTPLRAEPKLIFGSWLAQESIICRALSCISCDFVTGIVSSMTIGRFHAYPMTLSRESCHQQGAFICILWHVVLYIKSTKTLDIGRNFSYFLNLQYESRRLSSYLLKVNIDRTWARLEDGRTDGRNIFRPRNHETRRDEVENFGRLFGRLSSYRRTIANPGEECEKECSWVIRRDYCYCWVFLEFLKTRGYIWSFRWKDGYIWSFPFTLFT